MAAAVVVTVAAAALAYEWRAEVALRHQLTGEQQTITTLEKKLDAAQTDWPAIAATVSQSVVTVDAGHAIGSGWVAHTDAKGAEIVTNFHVVVEAWSSGNASVKVRQGDSTWSGMVMRVDRDDDLAVIHVTQRMTALTSAPQRPRVGVAVMAVGSPLGLDGTVSVGIVSGYRSLEGSNYMQFTAPISPGNSGGPVIDSRGRVVGIAAAKLVYPGAEALSLAIPVGLACDRLVTCSQA
jgi:putative serine protease PepD